MEILKLLIADGNEEFCAALESALREEFSIQMALDGNEAVTLLDRFQPDVMVLDLSLSGLDGIRVLEYAAERGHKIKVLATMLFRSDYIFAKLSQLKVNYVLLKPCNLQITAERVRDIAVQTAPVITQDDGKKLGQILLQLGVNPKHNGYHYLCTAVRIYAQDTTQALTKELYVAVGEVYGASWQQVERSIRAAVESAWNRRDDRLWQRWFPGVSALKRPTNGEVICGLAEQMLLEKVRRFG